MSELRDPMLDDLEGMFRRREGDVVGTLRLGGGARRRVRRRQGAMVGGSLLATALVLAVAISIVPSGSSVPTPLDGTGVLTSSVVQGATITYPDDWYLVALPEATSDWADQQPRSAFRPVFQLSNFDPVAEADGFRWFCPVNLGGRFPGDGVLLYIEAIGGPIADGATPWPVPYPTGSNQVSSGGGCGGKDAFDTSWTADGVTYHGVVMGDADKPELRAAFDSMRFSGGTEAVVGDVDEGTLTSEAYVLASGEGDGGIWNLLASPQPDPCLALAFPGEQVAWECGAWSLLGENSPIVSFADRGVVFGPVWPGTARLEFRRDDGGIEEVEVIVLPGSFGGHRAYAFDASGTTTGELVATDASGALIDAAPVTPAPTPSA